VLLTGRKDIGVFAKALGAVACLRKPVSDTELLDVVGRFR